MLGAIFRDVRFLVAELTDLPAAVASAVACVLSFRGRGSVDFFVVAAIAFFADALAGVFVATAGGSTGFVRRVPAFFFVSGNTSGLSISIPNTSAS